MAQRKTTSASNTAQPLPTTPRRRLNQRAIVIGFIALCLLALAVFAIRTNSRATLPTLDHADPTNVAAVTQGRVLYTTRCASCHGTELQGEADWPQRRANGTMPASPLNANGQAWQQSDQQLFTTIQRGGQASAPTGTISVMPAFGDRLGDSDIWAVLSYIKSTWPEALRQQQPSP